MTTEELKKAMEALELTQGELAKRLGIRPETVNRWLVGIKGRARKVPGPVSAAVTCWLEKFHNSMAQVSK